MQSDVRKIHNLDIPPLESILTAIKVRQSGSFTATAGELGLTHGAVSRRIAIVEQWAGFRMFERHGRGVRSTLRGDECITELEYAIGLLRKSREHTMETGELDIIHLSVVPSFARLWLMPNIQTLEGEPKDLHIEIEADHRFATVSETRLAVRFGLGQWAGVRSKPLFSERAFPAAALDIAGERCGAWTADEIMRHPILHDTTDEHWRAWFELHRMDYVRRPNDRVYSDYDLVLEAASRGMGIALLRAPYAVHSAHHLRLKLVSRQAIILRQRFHIVSKSSQHSKSVQRLLDRMLELAAQDERIFFDTNLAPDLSEIPAHDDQQCLMTFE
jgi:LysR family transcriptional regulator, glycine cleavage system transcriptional activator